MTLKYLSSTFGMYEMEAAAEEIISEVIDFGGWNIPIGYQTMDEANKSGFLQLVAYRWLTPYYWSKAFFRVTPKFIERITPKYNSMLIGLRPLDTKMLYPPLVKLQKPENKEA